MVESQKHHLHVDDLKIQAFFQFLNLNVSKQNRVVRIKDEFKAVKSR